MGPSGLRASDAPRIQELCGDDRRLLLRLGALLQQQVAVSDALLGELSHQPRLRELLLHPELPDSDDQGLASLVAQHGLASLAPLWYTEADWRVLALADESGNPFATPTPREQAPPTGVAALLPGLSRELRQPVEGLLHAEGDEARAAALEQLRYAAPPLKVVAELMPLVLADTAELVRERAVSLLVASGARSTVVDLIRALQRQDETGMRRLVEAIRGLRGEQADLAIAALTAAVAQGQCHGAIIDVAIALAGSLAGHGALTRLIELLLPHGHRLGLVGLVRAVQEHDAARMAGILRDLFGQSTELDANLIVLLAHPSGSGDARLLERGLDLLLSSALQPRDRLTLASALRRLDPDGRLPQRLADQAGRLLDCRETSPFWLIADLAEQGRFTTGQADRIYEQLHAILRDNDGTRQMAVLEQRLTALLPCSDALRAQALPLLADLAGRYRDRRSRELLGRTITGLGPAALDGLWDLAAHHPLPDLRRMAVDAVALLVPDADGQRLPAIERLVAMALRRSEPDELLECLVAAARLARRCATPEPSLAVDAAANRLEDRATLVGAHLLAGPHLPLERQSQLVDRLARALAADVPDAAQTVVQEDGHQDPTYVLDRRLGAHTDDIPRFLEAAVLIGTSPHVPAGLVRRLVGSLCRQWQRVASWQVIWGPANVQELAACLGRIAEDPSCPANLRLQIGETLLPRVNQLSVAACLGRIAAVGGSEPLAEQAGRACRRLIQLASGDSFADDEIPDLTGVLIAYLLAPDLGEDGAMLRQQLAGLLAGWRGRIPRRSADRLREGLATLDGELARRLAWVDGAGLPRR